jgi:hypothetical protein
MLGLLLLPAGLQALAMAVDEWVCHRKRGLPRWERIGHPVDTLSVAACYAWLVITPPTAAGGMPVYIVLAALSCLIITKDEPVHARLCDARESWLHSVLFVLHPIVFLTFALLWLSGTHRAVIAAQCAITILFAIYQAAYWSVFWRPTPNPSAR